MLSHTYLFWPMIEMLLDTSNLEEHIGWRRLASQSTLLAEGGGNSKSVLANVQQLWLKVRNGEGGERKLQETIVDVVLFQ